MCVRGCQGSCLRQLSSLSLPSEPLIGWHRRRPPLPRVPSLSLPSLSLSRWSALAPTPSSALSIAPSPCPAPLRSFSLALSRSSVHCCACSARAADWLTLPPPPHACACALVLVSPPSSLYYVHCKRAQADGSQINKIRCGKSSRVQRCHSTKTNQSSEQIGSRAWLSHDATQ
jgi:hypothetical protein